MKLRHYSAFCLFALFACHAHAITYTWDTAAGDATVTGGSGTWNTSSSLWTTDAGASNVAWPSTSTLNDDAVFGGTAGTVTVDAGGITANSITVNTANYIFQGGKITLDGTTPSVITTAAATINSEVGGTGGLTKSGAGLLTLTAANSYTGNTVIAGSSGVVNALRISNSSALGTGSLTIGSGGNLDQARLELTGGIAVANSVAALTSRNNFIPSILNVSGDNSMSANLSSGGGGGRITVQSDAGRLTLSGSVGFRNPLFKGNGDFLVSGSITSPSGYQSLTKEGNGTLILTGGSNATSTLTTITSGTLQIGNAGTTGTLGAAPVTNNATLVFNRTNDFTITNIISGTGKLTKQGTGVLTLSGANDYTGITTLSAGTISVGSIGNGGVAGPLGAASNAAANMVFDGGTLRYSAASATSTDRGFTINATKTGTFDVSDAAGQLTITGSVPTTTGTLYKTGSGKMILDPGSAAVMTYGALSANGGNLTLKSGTINTTGIDPAVSAYTTGAGAKGGTLTIDGATLNVGGGRFLKPGAAGNGTLDILSGAVNAAGVVIGHNGTVTATQSGGTVTTAALYHQDGGFGSSYSLTGGILEVQKIYNNTASTQDFTLNLNGGTLKSATGTTNLIDNQNTGTQLTVLLGAGNTVIDTTASSATIVRPLGDMPSVAGAFTKSGSNQLTLTAASTYSGVTTVTEGTLLANNTTGSATGSGGVKVDGGTLGGTGAISGAVTINTTGVISPGASIETLSVGALTLNTGSSFYYELNTGSSTADLLDVDGNLSLSGLVTLDLVDLGSNAALPLDTKFSLLSYSGAWNGVTFQSYADDSTFTLFNNQWRIDYNGLSSGSANGGAFTNAITMTVVPEPSSSLLSALSLLMLSRRRR